MKTDDSAAVFRAFGSAIDELRALVPVEGRYLRIKDLCSLARISTKTYALLKGGRSLNSFRTQKSCAFTKMLCCHRVMRNCRRKFSLCFFPL